ncbi:MAG: hypothetical protein LBS84_03260 [Clostridiales bacterium]|jgi:hypothetical protein|nr:hypothetical protein [Clostridiales bacterium]
MQPTDEQERNYAFYKKKLPELLADELKLDKYAVIYDEEIKGLYDTFDAAIRFAYPRFVRDFIVQQIVDESKIVQYLSTAVV